MRVCLRYYTAPPLHSLLTAVRTSAFGLRPVVYYHRTIAEQLATIRKYFHESAQNTKRKSLMNGQLSYDIRQLIGNINTTD